jgi:hypothetical protein
LLFLKTNGIIRFLCLKQDELEFLFLFNWIGRKLIALSLFIHFSRKRFIFDFIADTSKGDEFPVPQTFTNPSPIDHMSKPIQIRAQTHHPPRTRLFCFDSQEFRQFKNPSIVESWLSVPNGLLWWKGNAAMKKI